jgi:5-formyltetrahydrofolate cyclo-ligase
MEKPELRELFKLIRKSAANKKAESSALALVDRFKDFLLKNPIEKSSIIAAYLPAFSEISPIHLMEFLFKSGYLIAVPVVHTQNAPLHFYAWNPETPLQMGICKTLEPEQKSENLIPDIILMPLLAFDAQGYRLGMGAGYYDRTLEALNFNRHFPLLVGLAFSEQFVDELPKEAYDQPVHYVITEQRTFEF